MNSPNVIKMHYQDMIYESYKDRLPSLCVRAQGRDSIFDHIIQKQFQVMSNIIGGVELAVLRERQS